MRIKFATYAFRDILKLFQKNEITDFTITKEDGDLVIYIKEIVDIPKEKCYTTIK